MPRVCIIGAGELGGAVAHALARNGRASTILLVDEAAGIAAGKALDIQQSGAIEGFHARLEGTAELSRSVGSALCVIADRGGRSAGEWDGEEGLAMLVRLETHLDGAPIVFAGMGQAGLLDAASREIHLERARLVGSAPEAFIGAVKSIVAIDARCSPAEIDLTVLGAPGKGFVVPWGDASIGGYALERVLTHVQLSRLESRISRLWPPGPHALGQAAAHVVAAMLGSSRRAYCVLTMLGGEFGFRNRVGAVPARLSPRGIAAIHVRTLNTRDRVRVENALGAS